MIYIAGPMNGYPEMNFPSFHKAAKRLRDEGLKVINPAELNPDVNADWSDCMDVDIDAVFECDTIYMLKGWEKSKGARIEYRIAKNRKMEIYYEIV